MRNRPTALFLYVVIVLVMAGCSDSTSGTPTTATTTGTTTDPGQPTTNPPTSGPANRYGAPEVGNPLDATRYLTDPCTAISPRLLQSLGLPAAGKPDTTGAIGSRAPSCSWRAGDELASAGFLKANKNGLVDLYRGNASQPEAYWEEIMVEGYPGVFHSSVDSRSAGICVLAVGLNDALAMAIQESGHLGAGSCDRAKKIAAAVVQTLKGQG